MRGARGIELLTRPLPPVRRVPGVDGPPICTRRRRKAEAAGADLVSTAADLEEVTSSEVIKYSAGGFRDFTRIAASDPTMWRDVFLTNKDAVLDVLGRFTEELFALQRAIRMGDGDLLHAYFTRTRAIRRGIIEAGQDTAAPDFGRATLAVPKGG